MSMYRYVKATPKRSVKRPLFLSFGLITIGMSMLAWTVWPIISFSTLTENVLAKTISPIVDAEKLEVGSDRLYPDSSLMTNANVWFPTRPQKKVTTPVNTYALSIPKLKIKNAVVTIAGDDLATSLIHYGGTPVPGTFGNGVIFGHSTLPQFFSPTNYKSIFSTLPTIEKGDEIQILYDGIDYTYVVYDKVVVEPTDLSPLEQQFDDSYITVVTCVPPGTYWKRLNIKARLRQQI